MSAMNSRRLISTPRWSRGNAARLPVLSSHRIGLLHRKVTRLPKSAAGHERHDGRLASTAEIHLIADGIAAASQTAASAPTHAPQQNSHLSITSSAIRKHVARYVEAYRPSCLEVDDELILGRKL